MSTDAYSTRTTETPTQARPPVPGWGADARPEDRPGVPKEVDPPHPFGNPYWKVPEPQTIGHATAHGALRPLTPVYGTTCPLRGLSGLVRRAAYRIPDYRRSRWMLLALGDRIDVVEHNVKPLALLAGGLAIGFLAIRALRNR